MHTALTIRNLQRDAANYHRESKYWTDAAYDPRCHWSTSYCLKQAIKNQDISHLKYQLARILLKIEPFPED